MTFTPRAFSPYTRVEARVMFAHDPDELGRFKLALDEESQTRWALDKGIEPDRPWVTLHVVAPTDCWIEARRAECGGGCVCAAEFRFISSPQEPQVAECESCGEQTLTTEQEFEEETYFVCDPCAQKMWAELKRTGELGIPRYSNAGKEWAAEEAAGEGSS